MQCCKVALVYNLSGSCSQAFKLSIPVHFESILHTLTMQQYKEHLECYTLSAYVEYVKVFVTLYYMLSHKIH